MPPLAGRAAVLEAAGNNIPRRTPDRTPAGPAVPEQWNLRWSAQPPPPTSGIDQVMPIDDSDALNRRLHDSYDLVTLAVVAGNERAERTYQRLGYHGVIPLTSLWVGRGPGQNTGE